MRRTARDLQHRGPGLLIAQGLDERWHCARAVITQPELPFVATPPHVQLAVVGQSGGVRATTRELAQDTADLNEGRFAAIVAELAVRV
jgi:hypothetical protein